MAFDETHQDPRCRGNPSVFQRKSGVVNSAELADSIGRRYLISIYGPGVKPTKARLDRGVWYVQDTLPEGSAGGTKTIEICQSNGRVLRYFATQ